MTDAILLLHGQPGSGRDWARVTALRDQGKPAHAVRMVCEQIPGTRFVSILGAGHLLPQLHPKRLAEVIGGRERVPVA